MAPNKDIIEENNMSPTLEKGLPLSKNKRQSIMSQSKISFPQFLWTCIKRRN